MIPLRDLNPTRSRPVVTYALIALNALVYLYQVALQITAGDAAGAELVQRFGVVPYSLLHGGPSSWVTLGTSMFMHGGLLHVAGNMWFLHIFGDNVEDALGKWRYLFFYLVTGVGAAIAQVLIDPTSIIPMVGASGAIAGVLGAYVSLYPRARVVTVVPIFVFLQFIEVPAIFFVVVWFGLQLLNGWLSLGALNMGGVAFFAHIGGFLVGLALVRLLRKARPDPRKPVHIKRADWEARRAYDRSF